MYSAFSSLCYLFLLTVGLCIAAHRDISFHAEFNFSLLLRLFLKSSFDSDLYKAISRVHHGERTQVHQCRILAHGIHPIKSYGFQLLKVSNC